jgi:hypothetical protein
MPCRYTALTIGLAFGKTTPFALCHHDKAISSCQSKEMNNEIIGKRFSAGVGRLKRSALSTLGIFG